MARVAARHLLGEQTAQFAGADMSTKLKLMGVDVAASAIRMAPVRALALTNSVMNANRFTRR